MVKNICLLAFTVAVSLSFTSTALGAQQDDRSYALFGQVVSIGVSSATITVKLSNDTEQVAVVTNRSVLKRDRRSAGLNDFREGDQVIVIGTRNERGQIVAQRILGGEIPARLGSEWSDELRSILVRIAEYIELTAAQTEQIRQIINAAGPRIQPLLLRLAMTEVTMRTLSQNGTFNEMQVRILATQQGQIIAQMIVEKERLLAEIYSVLTPEQQAKFNRLQAQFLQILIRITTRGNMPKT
ncbi:MAG TPA: Spy/CpxP family protein refolding chaperone [Pyrinomonadaceae bacterium]|nr:Spy/CpxP family protein refolding chaperone [Pyrinomonadaceae bacterium]